MHDIVRRRTTAALLALSTTACAKTSTEMAIRGSPKLSTLDEKLAAEHERALRPSSPAGATI